MRAQLVRCGLALALILATAFYANRLTHGEAVPLAESLDRFPMRIGEWQGKTRYFAPEIYEKLGVSDSLLRVYFNPKGQRVWLYVGYYQSQRRGAQIHSPKYCLPGGGWSVLRQRVREIPIPSGEPVRAVEAVYQKGGEKEVFLYWYQSRGRYITSEYMQKLHMLLGALRYNRTDAAFVRYSVPVEQDDVAKAVRIGIGFIQQTVPILNRFLPGETIRSRRSATVGVS